jgi:hypothetical protein
MDVTMWEHRAFECEIFRCGKVTKFQWINLQTEIAWSDLEESAQVVSEIIKYYYYYYYYYYVEHLVCRKG